MQKKIQLSPTVLKYKGFRFFFFSAEEKRMHIHVVSNGAEAKFWVEPSIKMAVNNGFSNIEVKEIEKIVKENEKKIRDSWNAHFGC